MFKKIVEPRHDRRSTNFSELSRYMDDRWLAKGYTDRIGKCFYCEHLLEALNLRLINSNI